MENADVIIIGAGIIGCSLFYEFSKISSGKVILLDQGQLASGATGQSGGFIRKLNSDPYISQLSRESFDYYQNFHKETGESCGFVKTGLTYKVSNHMLLEMQNCLTELHSAEYPINISNQPSNSLIHEVNAGFIDTKLTCKSWVRAAHKNGAICYENVAVKDILIRENGIYGVSTTRGNIDCERMIIATGASTNQLLSSLDLILPICTKSFQYHIYAKAAQYLNTAYIDMLDQFYLFPLKNGDVLAGFLNKDQLSIDSQFDQILDDSLATTLHNLLSRSFPWINSKPYEIKKSYDAFTPDHHGIIDKSSIEGLFFATGFSSGGIKIAPAVAKKIAPTINAG